MSNKFKEGDRVIFIDWSDGLYPRNPKLVGKKGKVVDADSHGLVDMIFDGTTDKRSFIEHRFKLIPKEVRKEKL